MLKKPDNHETTDWKPPTDKLSIVKILIDRFPYYHFDVWAVHPDFNDKLVFGVPLNHEEGMKFYKLTKEGAKVVKNGASFVSEYKGLLDMTCPFCDSKFKLTKFFKFSSTERLQFKCPDCYLTRYKVVN